MIQLSDLRKEKQRTERPHFTALKTHDGPTAISSLKAVGLSWVNSGVAVGENDEKQQSRLRSAETASETNLHYLDIFCAESGGFAAMRTLHAQAVGTLEHGNGTDEAAETKIQVKYKIYLL